MTVSTPRALIELRDIHKSFGGIKAVDGEFARWGDAVRTGSEIAFIPPVSGG